jgi:hypothetical protein
MCGPRPTAAVQEGVAMLWAKSLLSRPYSERNLYSWAEKYLLNPPLPPELQDAARDVRGRDGSNLMDLWRSHFSQELSEIAAKQTRRLQRAHCIKLMFMEASWRATLVVAKNTKYPKSWSHFVRDNELFDVLGGHDQLPILYQRYLLAMTSWACLSEALVKLFGSTTKTELEIDWCYQIEMDVKLIDVTAQDVILALVDDGAHDATVMECASYKDDIINPFLRKGLVFNARFQEQIATDQFDLPSANKIAQQFEAEKKIIVAKLSEYSKCTGK